MGPSLPRSLDHTGRGSPQTGTTCQWQPGLALCFHPHEQYNSPHALIRCRTPWHHDWQHMEHQHMWPSRPTPDMETTATWGTCSIPQRTKWETGCSMFLLPWIATMGYCHHRQISWGTASHRSDLRGSRAWIHANHTPFFSKLSSSLPSWHTGWEITLWGPGISAPFPNKGSAWPGGDRLTFMSTYGHLPQASPGNTTLRDSSTIVQVSHSLSLATASKSPAASTSSDHQPQALSRAGLSNIPQEVAWLQKEMNVALGQLLSMKTALDSHQMELEPDLDSAMQQCGAQATRAIQEVEFLCTATIKEVEAHHVATIKEAEDCHTAWVHALQQSHREGILKFESEALEKEEHTHLLLLEACRATLRACLIEAHGVLLFPLQLLMGNILLASLLTAAPQPAPLVREPPSTIPPPSTSKPPSCPTGTKWQCHPSREEATGSAAPAKEPTHWRQKEGKPLVGLKENCQ